MGNKQGASASAWITTEEKSDVEGTLVKWRQKYNVKEEDWKMLRQMFDQLTEGPNKNEASLTAVQNWFSENCTPWVGKQLTRVIDADNSGSVELLEFMFFWCVHIGGSDTQKISYYFHLLDLNGDNKVTKQEMVAFFKGENATSEERTRLIVDKVFTDLDANKNGSLSLNEVLTGCNEMPEYMELFISFADGIKSVFIQ